MLPLDSPFSFRETYSFESASAEVLSLADAGTRAIFGIPLGEILQALETPDPIPDEIFTSWVMAGKLSQPSTD